jgi:surface protein
LLAVVTAMICALGIHAQEAYAVYTEDNSTLTFYYDNLRSSRPGVTYDLNTGTNHPGWDTDHTRDSVTNVVFDPSFADARPTTTYFWFYGMQILQSITGLSYLNTSEVTNMRFMFMACESLTSLDLSSFNTSQVKDMGFMFSDCSILTSLNVSTFNTANVTDMQSMFDYCPCLTRLDLSSFNTSQVHDMSWMFYGNHGLRTIYVGDGWTTAAVWSLSYSSNMFKNCTSLVGGLGTPYNDVYAGGTRAHIDGGSSNPGYLTDINGPEAYACYTPENTTLTFCYDKERSTRPGTIYDLNTITNDPEWYTDGTKSYVTKVVFDPLFAGYPTKTTFKWFYEMGNLQTITGLSYMNTSELIYMGYMFYSCNKLTSLDLSSFYTPNVTKMGSLFYGCSGLTSLDLSCFNTSKVTDMTYMFNGCSNLQTIYASNGWSTEAVSISFSMFFGCTSLVGGMGTAYDASNPRDKTYARIDGGPDNPGYFAEKIVSLRGDVNGDALVNITDAIRLITAISTGNFDGVNTANANVNGDSEVNITDVIQLINYVSTGHW